MSASAFSRNSTSRYAAAPHYNISPKLFRQGEDPDFRFDDFFLVRHVPLLVDIVYHIFQQVSDFILATSHYSADICLKKSRGLFSSILLQK
jgi:hypothetical protein